MSYVCLAGEIVLLVVVKYRIPYGWVLNFTSLTIYPFLEGSVYERMLDVRLLWFAFESVKLGRQAQESAKLEKETVELDEVMLERKCIKLEKDPPMLYSEIDDYELKCFLKAD